MQQPSLPPTRLYSWKAINPNARCVYIKNLEQADTEVALLKQGPVGFDLEWRPSFRKGEGEHPVSLVQISNDETILLVQVSAMSKFPLKLQEFLENPNIVKAGVAIQNDTQKLYKDHQVSTRSCVDLSLLAKCVENTQWKGKYRAPIGLSRLVEYYENATLAKGRITRSNWASELTDAQLEYASNDAHAGYTIYMKLLSMIPFMPTIPKSVYYTFDSVRGRLCEPSGMAWNPFNPDYDPGPPPPPKTPAIPTDTGLTITGASASSNIHVNVPSVLLASTSSVSNPGIPYRDSIRSYHTQASPSSSSRGSRKPHNDRQQHHHGQYSSSRPYYTDSKTRTSKMASTNPSSSFHLDRNIDPATACSGMPAQPKPRPQEYSVPDQTRWKPRDSLPQHLTHHPNVARNIQSGLSSSHADGVNSSSAQPGPSDPAGKKRSRRRRRTAHDRSTTEDQGNVVL